MMRHTIIVTVSDGSVRAENNPQAVDPGDVVTWLVADGTVKDLRVVFKGLEAPSGLKPIPPLGPFYELLTDSDRIVGTVSGELGYGRFIYNLFAGDTQLSWRNRLPEGNFGGIDIPRPPGG